PLPWTTHVPMHDDVFVRPDGSEAYHIPLDEVPYGCFHDGGRLAIALTNPTFDDQDVGFRLERGRYGVALEGNQRVTVQRLTDTAPELVLEQATGDLDFRIRLRPREWAMVVVEPTVSFT